MNKKQHLLELTEAQLLGFTYGRDGYDIESLCTSMGLSIKEWEDLEKKFDMTYLTKIDREEINKIFK